MPNLYSDFIDRCRAEVGDFPVKRFETADGDGSSTLFRIANAKIKESSYTVKVSNVVKTEGVDFQVDPDVGDFIFGSGSVPPDADDNVAFSYSSVNEKDTDWLRIANNALNRLYKKLWVEVVDETTFTTDSNATEYDLSALSGEVISVLSVEIRSTPDTDWQSIKSYVNVWFNRSTQKLHVEPKFSISGYGMRIRVLRTFVQGTALNSTFEPDEKYWPILLDLCKAEYFRRRSAEAMKQTAGLSKEKTFETAQDLLRLARDIEAAAMDKLKQMRPTRPAVQIPIKIH